MMNLKIFLNYCFIQMFLGTIITGRNNLNLKKGYRMMRKFYQNKLWREKLIKLKEEKGAIVHIIPLAHSEFGEELGMKLIEEANEFYGAETHKEMVDQIVDLLEAVDALMIFHGISQEEVMKLKVKKLEEFGSYTEHKLVDYVEYPVGSEDEKYCLKHPDRYPELTDEAEINSCCNK